MAINPDRIIELVQSDVHRPMKTKELAEALEIPARSYPAFRKQVKELVAEGRLVLLKRNRIGLPDQLGVEVGKISISRGGTGFLLRENQPDLLIPPHELLTALDGDKVMVRHRGRYDGRDAASVIRVVERARRNIVGTYSVDRFFSCVIPDNPRIHRSVYIAADKSSGAKDGEKVVARITEWEDPYRNPEGEVVERLGRATDPGVDMMIVIRSHDLETEFPQEVMEQAERAAAKLTDDLPVDRPDLSNKCIYTIDPFDAKDHDDAVSVEKTARGYRLGVHIADVSWYVEPGSELDQEALRRGNSVYLPGMVIPMLPELLSNDVCSLKPNRKRLAHSVLIEFDNYGKMLNWKVQDTIIESKAKLSYEEVQDLFDSNPVPPHVSRVKESLELARELAAKISHQRLEAGSLDFDLPEAKIILGENGEVLELGSRVRLESHRLVEEFMLSANKAVALEVFRHAQPFIYRVHERPDQEKMNHFSDMMKRLGHSFPVSKTVKPRQFARFLGRIKGTPEADFINELMLRTMQKAVYQQENIGHFGLAFKHYTHFTSPIRRYPDLLVHRLLRKLSNGQYPAAFARRVGATIDSIASHCSKTERTAESAERQAVRVKQAAFMAQHLGEQYEGVITGVIPHGFFVRLKNMGVEGLVKVSAIDDDFYDYDEANYRMVGRRKKRSFRLGDAVEVQVVKVDTERQEIDLTVAGGGGSAGKKSRVKSKGRRPLKTGKQKKKRRTSYKK